MELRMYVVVCAKAQHIRSSSPATCAFSLFKGKGASVRVGVGGRHPPARGS